MPNPVYHWSQLSMYTRCAEQYRRRYVEGEILPPAVAQLAGSGMHRGIELDLTRKLETGKLADGNEVIQAARDTVMKGFEGDVLLSEDEVARGKDALRDEAIDAAVKCAYTHHWQLAPEVEPVAVERKWIIAVKGFPVDFAGTIDCDEGLLFDDWKSAAKSPVAGAADKSGQLTMYSIAKYVLDGEMPSARIGYVIKTKEAETLWQVTSRTLEDVEPFLCSCMAAVEGIERGVFPFASLCDPRPWNCDPRYCGYYKTCRGVRKPKTFGTGGEK